MIWDGPEPDDDRLTADAFDPKARERAVLWCLAVLLLLLAGASSWP